MGNDRTFSCKIKAKFLYLFSIFNKYWSSFSNIDKYKTGVNTRSDNHKKIYIKWNYGLSGEI